ncbi:MAG: hypothetical protein AAGB93_21130 [Planctomycetota bacterium]
MSRIQLVGLLLWRAGLLLAGSYTAFRLARLAWEHLDLPAQLDWGLGLVATGALMVAASFVAERLVDRRAEGALGE